MAEIRGKVTTSQGIGGKIKATSAVNGDIDNEVKDRIIKDYNQLRNKPSIEGVELKGNLLLEAFGITRVLYKTTAEWNAQSSLVGVPHTLYCYTDYDVDSEGNIIAGFKMGDGNSYLLDAPFLDANYYAHIRNDDIHVTAEQKEFWNNRVRYGTTEYWNDHPTQTEEGYLYIYSDYKQLDGRDIPGVKIGDGNAYLSDLPFTDSIYAQHIANAVIHVSQSDRNYWDNKVTCFIDPNNNNKLIFTKRSEEEYNNA